MADAATPAAAAPAAADAAQATAGDTYQSDFSAMMKEMRGEAAQAPPAKKAEIPPAKEEDAEEEGDVEEPGEDEDAAEPDAEEDDAAEGEDAEEEKEEEDPKGTYSKNLRALQKKEEAFEKHKATVLAKERDLTARERAYTDRSGKLEDLIQAMLVDPVGTLEREGRLSEEDKQHWAKQFHYTSGEAAKDPRSRAEAERLVRERQHRDLLKKQQERLDAMEKERAEERAKAAQTAELNNYVTKLDTTVGQYRAKTPLLEQALSKNAEKTTRELRQIAHDLSVAQNEWAEPKAVVTEWVKRRKELLAELGIAEPAATATSTTNKAKSKSAVEKKGPGTEPTKKGSSSAAPPANETPEQRAAREEREYRKELRRMTREARGLPAED